MRRSTVQKAVSGRLFLRSSLSNFVGEMATAGDHSVALSSFTNLKAEFHQSFSAHFALCSLVFAIFSFLQCVLLSRYFIVSCDLPAQCPIVCLSRSLGEILYRMEFHSWHISEPLLPHSGLEHFASGPWTGHHVSSAHPFSSSVLGNGLLKRPATHSVVRPNEFGTALLFVRCVMLHMAVR